MKPTISQLRDIRGRRVTGYLATFGELAADGGSPQEASAHLDTLVQENIQRLSEGPIFGTSPRCEVRTCVCWANHFDPVGIYFD